jgi:predicted naringenin-chalcone synthase
MFFQSVATATPPRRYTQAECWEALKRSPPKALSSRGMATVERMLTRASGIEARALAMDLEDPAELEIDPDRLNARFMRHAPALAAEAARKALDEAGLGPAQIDALVISTCTGYACPGLTSYVAETLGLNDGCVHLDLVGQGCGAALPNLRAAEALVRSGQARHAVSICVEVCSAALYFEDDLGVIVSACLFGDGAAAAVVSSEPPATGPRVEWKRAWSKHDPSQREALRFEQRGGVLRNILTLPVPQLAGAAARAVLEQALANEGLAREDIAAWILHGGGRNVLREVQRQLPLEPDDVRWSTKVLREYGNMSSPSVLFAMREALQGGAPRGWWWLASFGAGFSSHGALVNVS